MTDKFLVSLVLTVLCYKAVSSEASSNVTQFSDIQRWNEQEVMDDEILLLDEINFVTFFSVECYEDNGICEFDYPRNETQLECGRTPNMTVERNEVVLISRVEGLDTLKTTIGIRKVGKPLECTIVHGIQPLRDFFKTRPELMKFRDITWRLKQLMFASKWNRQEFRIESVFGKPPISPIEDKAHNNLCLTEREWIFIAIACVVLALCINNILLPRLKRERIKVHYPVSETLKLPH
ncbi:unnamed protein product [Auanema sp. JU1783]|nr:unnamed protein product [Auanema sp. JU1783]